MKEEKDYIMTLDNGKKYAMVDAISFENKKYVYLAEINDFANYIIGEVVDDDQVIQVEDEDLLGKLIMEFAKSN